MSKPTPPGAQRSCPPLQENEGEKEDLWGEGNAAGIAQEQRGAGRVAAFLFASLPTFLNSGAFLHRSLWCCPILCCSPQGPLVWGANLGQPLAPGWAVLGAWGSLSGQTHPGQNTGTCRGDSAQGQLPMPGMLLPEHSASITIPSTKVFVPWGHLAEDRQCCPHASSLAHTTKLGQCRGDPAKVSRVLPGLSCDEFQQQRQNSAQPPRCQCQQLEPGQAAMETCLFVRLTERALPLLLLQTWRP